MKAIFSTFSSLLWMITWFACSRAQGSGSPGLGGSDLPPGTFAPSYNTSTPAANRVLVCNPTTEDFPPTTVDGCRGTLRKFTTYPNWRRRQIWVNDRDDPRPRQPSTPPYIIEDPDSTCIAAIASPYMDRRGSWFSFQDAKSLAQDVIEYCQDYGGTGGFASIGSEMDGTPNNYWIVTVKGRVPGPQPSQVLEAVAAESQRVALDIS